MPILFDLRAFKPFRKIGYLAGSLLDLLGTRGGVSTAADVFVREASPYRTASASHIADTEIYLPDELSVRLAEKFRYFCVRLARSGIAMCRDKMEQLAIVGIDMSVVGLT